jgi:hypothetical protein
MHWREGGLPLAEELVRRIEAFNLDEGAQEAARVRVFRGGQWRRTSSFVNCIVHMGGALSVTASWPIVLAIISLAQLEAGGQRLRRADAVAEAEEAASAAESAVRAAEAAAEVAQEAALAAAAVDVDEPAGMGGAAAGNCPQVRSGSVTVRVCWGASACCTVAQSE